MCDCFNSIRTLCRELPEIGDVDESIVEGRENTGDAEDELAW